MPSAGIVRFLPSLALMLVGPLLAAMSTPAHHWQDRLLAAHNRERQAVGVPALAWDEDLAESARGWADQLASTGAFHHAPESAFRPQGENLWAGTRGAYSIEEMVGAWAREKRYFKMGTFPNNSTTGRVADVGHYTQLIWRQTDRVGCAIASGSREDVLVCRYSNAGNYRGERPL